VAFEEVCEITDDRPGKDAAYRLDSTKLRTELRWKDNISLQEGLRRTVDWAKENQAELMKQPFNYIHKP
jgi:dTDP-glucose 4,6-dehydratase